MTRRPRTLAIGDIHGTAAAFITLLAAVEPGPDDIVVPLGDYVDRGPDSAGVLRTLLDWVGRCHLMPIRGNHDQLMLDARRDADHRRLWLTLGGDATLASYAGGTVAEVPDDHWTFLATACVDSVETATHLFVHGGVMPELPVECQSPAILQWQAFPPPVPHVSGKVIVCGHTWMRDGRPASVGHAICLDTGAERPGGWLTALDVATGDYWQADQNGHVRTGTLSR